MSISLQVEASPDCTHSADGNNFSTMKNKCAFTEVINDKYFFEGAEKLLEIWFNENSDNSLRQIPYVEIVRMLEAAHCHVLQKESNDYLDSYILSESSLFVWKNRFVLKTCGETKLLDAIEPLLQLAKQYCSIEKIGNVFYSRKNFLKPEQQPFPHNSFNHEISFLDQYFQDSVAFCFGSLKHDHWFFYTLATSKLQANADHTLEILMNDLPKDITDIFRKDACIDGKQCTTKAGIDRIVPVGTIIHEELFDPCGYSMNGFLSRSDEYVTVHVTPEHEFSYVSFETNQTNMCLYKQICLVLETFKPSKFMINLFSSELSVNGIQTQRLLWSEGVPGYKKSCFHLLQLKDEIVAFAQFEHVMAC